MKTMKLIAIITTIITVILCGTMACAEDKETFELLGMVTAFQDYDDCTEYTVTVEDGTMLAFYCDKGEFGIGDLVYLTVWDEVQQEVLDVEWIATLEWDEMFRWLDHVNK